MEDMDFFQVIVRETDLDIGVLKGKIKNRLIEKVYDKVIKTRLQLEKYLELDPIFAKSLSSYTPLSSAPKIAKLMAHESSKAGVGPMASVAGAFSELVGNLLSLYSQEVIVENGGDIYLRSSRDRTIGIYAANSPFSNRIAIKIKAYQTPLGICTSSGTVGHSLSFGKADAVVVLSPSVPLADAVATASANMVKNASNLQEAVEFAINVPGVKGALAIKGDKLSAVGDIEITPVSS